mmetsp:Transcript_38828/g.123444  ORF Transcript_38828/g.123444 Transcript_38828/m.123444 type:complete len:316 (+) Transcript_38828:329-1276(+)
MAEGGALAHGAQVREALLVHGNALHGGTDGEDLHHLLGGIGQGADDDKAVQQIHGDPVRRGHVRAADRAHAAVGREDHDGREGRLERPVEVGEALHVEHVHLVHKQHARDELSHPLVDVPVDHLVDLLPQLLRDLRLLRLHHLPHDRHDVLPTLRLGVGTVQVVQGHVLHDLLLLVHVALGQGYVLLRLQVVLGRIRVTPPHALHCTTRREESPSAHRPSGAVDALVIRPRSRGQCGGHPSRGTQEPYFPRHMPRRRAILGITYSGEIEGSRGGNICPAVMLERPQQGRSGGGWFGCLQAHLPPSWPRYKSHPPQ